MAINLSQQRFLQPLRSNVLGSYNLAIEALNNVASKIVEKGLSTKADGSTVVARYNTIGEGIEGNEVKSIFGIFHGATGKITIYSHDDEKLQGLLNGLDSRLDVIEGEGEGSIKKAVSDAKSELVNGASAGYQTLKELETKIKALDGAVGEGGSVSAQIQNAINGLDSEETGDGTYVDVTVKQVDGFITEVSVDEASLNSKIEEIVTSVSTEKQRAELAESDLTDAIAAEKQRAELKEGELAQAIADVSDAAKSYSIAKVEGDELTALGENVKEAWKLVDEDGKKAGETISIYKDSSLEKVELVGQELQFTYLLADGTTSTVDVDVSKFLAESEFGNGLAVSAAGVVSVKVDAASESFLSVGADGVKLAGVQDAINAAVKVEKERAELAESNLTDAIAAEKERAELAESALSERLDALEEGENSVSTQIQNAINGLNSTATSTNGQFVNITVVEENGELSSASVDESVLNSKIEEIVTSVSTEKQRAELAESGLTDAIAAEATKAREEEGKLAQAIATQSAAAKTEVVGGTTNPILSVRKDETAADGHVKYIIDLADSWDCGTFEYTE